MVYEGQRPAGVPMPRLCKKNRSRGLTTRQWAASMIKSLCFQMRLETVGLKVKPSESGLKSSTTIKQRKPRRKPTNKQTHADRPKKRINLAETTLHNQQSSVEGGGGGGGGWGPPGGVGISVGEKYFGNPLANSAIVPS